MERGFFVDHHRLTNEFLFCPGPKWAVYLVLPMIRIRLVIMQVWNLTNCKLRSNLVGHTGYINTVTVSPDGSLCASGGKVRPSPHVSLSTAERCALLHNGKCQAHSYICEALRLCSVQHSQSCCCMHCGQMLCTALCTCRYSDDMILAHISLLRASHRGSKRGIEYCSAYVHSSCNCRLRPSRFVSVTSMS